MKFLAKFLLKILAIPLILALSILVPFMSFLFCFSERICMLVASLLAALVIIGFIMDGFSINGIVVMVMAFLISPFGLHSIIEWFIGLLDELNYSLKGFVLS